MSSKKVKSPLFYKWLRLRLMLTNYIFSINTIPILFVGQCKHFFAVTILVTVTIVACYGKKKWYFFPVKTKLIIIIIYNCQKSAHGNYINDYTYDLLFINLVNNRGGQKILITTIHQCFLIFFHPMYQKFYKNVWKISKLHILK